MGLYKALDATKQQQKQRLRNVRAGYVLYRALVHTKISVGTGLVLCESNYFFMLDTLTCTYTCIIQTKV